MELQNRIFQYLSTVDKASPRRIARALGESRPCVKRALEEMAKAGDLENLVEKVWIAQELFNELVLAAKPAERSYYSRVTTHCAQLLLFGKCHIQLVSRFGERCLVSGNLRLAFLVLRLFVV
jgi:hypothetical protein